MGIWGWRFFHKLQDFIENSLPILPSCTPNVREDRETDTEETPQNEKQY